LVSAARLLLTPAPPNLDWRTETFGGIASYLSLNGEGA
jgi:hypothetical protein